MIMGDLSSPFLTISWSPPSDASNVGGYVFGVAGDCGDCVSMNVSADTTSVTCSGWTAAGQTCSFEVRTLSKDCGFTSDPVTDSVSLTGELHSILVVGTYYLSAYFVFFQCYQLQLASQ